MTGETENNVPLFVDLDGTLIAADALVVAIKQLVREKPWCAVLLPWWLRLGRARFKHRVFERVDLDVKSLPWRQAVLSYLGQQKAAGRWIILATANHQKIADAVAAHLGLFDGVIASDKGANLKGAAKRAAIQKYTDGKPFDYMGDSMADLPIMEAARCSLLVHPSAKFRKLAEARCHVAKVFE
jgi:phosphoserine phosphatase